MRASVAPEKKQPHTGQVYTKPDWILVEDVEDSDLYAAGRAKIILHNGDQPLLALALTLELSHKICEQTLRGEEYCQQKARADVHIPRLMENLALVENEYKARKLRAQQFAAHIGARKPTDKEMTKGKKLVLAMTDAAQLRQELEKERADLLAQVHRALARYLACTEQVDDLQYDVFTLCGLMQGYERTQGSPLEAPPSDDPSTVADTTTEDLSTTNEESHDAKQARITLRLVASRETLLAGYQKMDDHRISYRSALQEYIETHAAAPDVDLREEFSRKLLEEGRKLTQMIASAGKSVDDALDEAAAASISVPDPEDSGEEVFAYKDEDFAEYLKATVDREFVQGWLQKLAVGAEPDMLSAGWLEAEEEELKMKKRTAETNLDDPLRLKKTRLRFGGTPSANTCPIKTTNPTPYASTEEPATSAKDLEQAHEGPLAIKMSPKLCSSESAQSSSMRKKARIKTRLHLWR
jgi:hypothetical protein